MVPSSGAPGPTHCTLANSNRRSETYTRKGIPCATNKLCRACITAADVALLSPLHARMMCWSTLEPLYLTSSERIPCANASVTIVFSTDAFSVFGIIRILLHSWGHHHGDDCGGCWGHCWGHCHPPSGTTTAMVRATVNYPGITTMEVMAVDKHVVSSVAGGARNCSALGRGGHALPPKQARPASVKTWHASNPCKNGCLRVRRWAGLSSA